MDVISSAEAQTVESMLVSDDLDHIKGHVLSMRGGEGLESSPIAGIVVKSVGTVPCGVLQLFCNINLPAQGHRYFSTVLLQLTLRNLNSFGSSYTFFFSN